MLRRIFAFFLTISLASLAPALAAPATQDLSGTWIAEVTAPFGQVELALRLMSTPGGRLTGFLVAWTAMANAPIRDGHIVGDAVLLTVATESFGQPHDRHITGNVSGNELRFSMADLLGIPRPSPATDNPGDSGSDLEERSFFGQEVVFRLGTSHLPDPISYRALPRIALQQARNLEWNGLARTPPMGWNSWNKFRTHIDDGTVRQIADAMVRNGMREAGYRYVIVDDGWQGTRDTQGVLHPNSKFPDMKGLADYLSSKGLKLGIYSSPGPRTCAGFEGSYGHEATDAQTWAGWGVDYLKYDWCTGLNIWPTADMRPVYQRMGQALRATQRPIIFSLSQYGLDHVEHWSTLVGGNLWRTSVDIRDRWTSVLGKVLAQEKLAPRAGPGHWNDPDMLEIGNGGMTTEEYRTQFSLWATVAAPLVAGNDLRDMTSDTLSILLNKEVIAIDQDHLGQQGRLVAREGRIDIWLRPLAGDAYALAFVNRDSVVTEVRPNWSTLRLSTHLHARDLWQHLDLGVLSALHTLRLLPHGVVMLKLTQ